MSDAESTVFLIDDDEDIRSSLARSLRKRGLSVTTFASAMEFLDSYDPDKWGCIVLDHGMPGMTGLELQEHLVKRGMNIPIIFITGHGGVPESVQAIKMGAVDFLEKPFRTEVLLERVSAVFRLKSETRSRQVRSQEARAKLDKLTTREREIVDFIIENPATTSSKEIARTFDISPRTVDHHRARILEKLEVKSIVELLDLLIASGLYKR